MRSVTVALDWAPNTNHAGILVALANNWYSEAGLDVKLISTEADEYAVYPIQKLVEGLVDVAMAPSEHVIYYHHEGKILEPIAIASVFQEDSSLMLIRNSTPQGPAGLDHKIYLGYQTRFEEDVIQHMVRFAGGKGMVHLSHPPKLSLWDSFIHGEGDACWVFKGWEYAQAVQVGMEVKPYRLADYGVPYGYSPVLIANRSALDKDPMPYKSFIKVTQRGYQFVVEHPLESALLMKKVWEHKNTADPAFTLFSLMHINDSFLTPSGNWGYMSQDRWHSWSDWLSKKQLIVDANGTAVPPERVQASAFFQNLI